MATSYEWRTTELLDRLRNETHGKRRHGRPANSLKDGIGDNLQRRNLEDEECFDRELWRKKLCLWVEENCVFTEKFLYTVDSGKLGHIGTRVLCPN
jgi:hypothetical protein